MKKTCHGFGVFCIIFGLIGSIVLANNFGVSVEVVTNKYLNTETIVTRDWTATIAIFGASFISSVILAVILFALSDILEKLEKHSELLEKAEPGLKEMSASAEKKEIVSFGGWVCPKCGEPNRFYTKICSCGYKKEPEQPEEDNAPSVGGWQCPVCKRHNMGFEKKCKCGQDKPE